MTSPEPTLFFADNTVLNNFALLRRMDLLADVLGDRGRWCATVSQECERGARKPGLEQMALAPDIFGAPMIPRTADLVNIRTLRESMLSPGDGPTAHLGEAETIIIMTGHGYESAFFVTDDRGAQREAERAGLRCVSTWIVLRSLVRARRFETDDLLNAARVLATHRRTGPPGWPDVEAVRAWIHA